ncbi:hypothetical protein NDU88_002591 [Pleurodeles waltl]|uniref:Uncharacterized protein n=1 Tax=Pleurodeles waltl TaxID=8319 RepID=A0AAV7T2P3_PLEWA|nr:hypothetical protein NDU88_002591 [Pleurodeles waltl]
MKPVNIRVGENRLTSIGTFPYLGVSFSASGSGAPYAAISRANLARSVGSRLSLPCPMVGKALAPVAQMYPAQYVPIAVYGAECKKEEASLTREIIMDCLACEKVPRYRGWDISFAVIGMPHIFTYRVACIEVDS